MRFDLPFDMDAEADSSQNPTPRSNCCASLL